MRVAVIGGGISGCTVASELATRSQAEVTLIESTDRLGGLHRSVEAGGYVFDIGAFVFEDDHEIFSVFPELLEIFPRVPNRYGTVQPGGVLDEYPLSIAGTRREFGTAFLGRVLLEALVSKVRHYRKDSVHGFVAYYIGPTLYRRSGLKTYIERLYLSSDDKIDVEFVQKRLDVLADSASLRRNLQNLVALLLRGQNPLGAIDLQAVGSLYVRPETGFGTAYERIGKRMTDAGVTVLLDRSISRIEQENALFRLRGLEGDDPFDHVFSTIPLETAARLLGLEGFVSPEYMDLYSLFYELDGKPRFPFNVLHNFTRNGQWKRLTVFSYYYGDRQGRHYLTVEGTTRQGGESAETLRGGAEDFENWMRSEKLLPGNLRCVGGVVTPRSYPVYRKTAARSVEQLKRSVEARGLRLTGRQGTFDYISSSDVVAHARVTARLLLDELSPRE